MISRTKFASYVSWSLPASFFRSRSEEPSSWVMATRNSADHLTVHRLELVDTQEKERLRLYTDASGDPHIDLLDKDGKVTYRQPN